MSGPEYGDALLMSCLVQACAILLHDNEGVVVSPEEANGKLLYVWRDSQNDLISIVELHENEEFFEDSEKTRKISTLSDLEIGSRIWLTK
jgi:hypothetical protein